MFGAIYFGQIEFASTPLYAVTTAPVLFLDLSAPDGTTAGTELLPHE